MIHKLNIVLILSLLAVFFYFVLKVQYIPAIIILITIIAIVGPLILDPENFKKDEICKYHKDGKCYIDDMTDKIDCTGKDHDLEHCGDYQAYKSGEANG